MLHADGLDTNVVAEVETVDATLELTSATPGQCILPDRIPPQRLPEYHLVRALLHG
jgi:LysR family cyn operon transcriptional activator